VREKYEIISQRVIYYMSTLLEQAVIDAGALKEAAIKNAENAVLEKYAPEVKKVLGQILEAEEDLGGEEEEMDMMAPPGGEEDPASDVADDMVPAYAEGEKLCPCPDEEEEVVIPLDDLLAQAEKDQAEGGMGMDDEPMSREEDIFAEAAEFELNDIVSILEDMKVDVHPVPHGHVGGATGAEIEQAKLQALANERDNEVQEENEELKKSVADLEESLKSLNTEVERQNEENIKYKSAVEFLKEKIEEVNLSNARLVYTNKVLNSASLNERQKTKIVDALSKSQTIEEAKVIFETLQSAVGVIGKKAPESLSEVIRRAPNALPRRKRKSTTLEDQSAKRMKRLAGLE
jgi:hypothetical protein